VISEASAREFRRVLDQEVFPQCWQGRMDPLTGAMRLAGILGNFPRSDDFTLSLADILDRAMRHMNACETIDGLKEEVWGELEDLLAR